MHSKNYNLWQKMTRNVKLKFLKLLRSPGGANKVSLGFAIGFGLEMLVISTASLIYILLVPLVRITKSSLPAAVIGNVIGKLTFLPVLLLPFARKIGKWIYPIKVKHTHLEPFSLTHLLHGDFKSLITFLYNGIHILIGMGILGLLLGAISYFVVHYYYNRQKQLRQQKRQKRVLYA